MKKLRSNVRTISILLISNLFLVSCSNTVNDALDNIGNDSNKIEKNTLGATSKIAQEYSGEDLFKSIFFAYGDFAKKISSYDNIIAAIDAASPSQHDAFNERFNSFVTKINNEDPDFFPSFKRDILSGDNLQIKGALNYGSEKIYDNIDIVLPELKPLIEEFQKDEKIKELNIQDGEISQEDLTEINQRYAKFMSDNYQMEAACSWAVVCAAYFVVGVHNTVGFTINVAAVAAVYWKAALWGPKLDSYKKGKSLSILEEDTLKYEMFIQEIADASTN